MRIVVVSPPRSGNHWIECLLGSIYQLDHFGGAKKPSTTKVRDVRDWINAGGFADDSIFHLHCRFRDKLCDLFEGVPAHLVTIVRDPYDTFVSRYYWTQDWLEKRAQHRPDKVEAMDTDKAEARARQVLAGKSLDDPDVLDYLEDESRFGTHLRHAVEWKTSGRAAVVRYEDLHTRPEEALKTLTDQLSPVDPARISAAIAACQADQMRAQSTKMTWNVRSAKVGDSREQLSAAQLTILRDNYADLIRELGYDVREPADA